METSTRRDAFKWYLGQMRRAKGLTAAALAVSVSSSLCMDVGIPYFIAWILELLPRSTSKSEYVVPMVLLASFSVLACFLQPARQKMRRRMYGSGVTFASEHVEQLLRTTRGLSQHSTSGDLRSALTKFYATWDRVVVTVFEQFIPFVVGVSGLLVILLIKAPSASIIVVVTLIMTTFFVLRASKTMGANWGDYKRQETDEIAILGDQLSSVNMLWLLKILTKMREETGKKRRQSMKAFVKAMGAFLVGMQAFTSFFKVGSIFGGVAAVLVFDVQYQIAALLVINGITLSEKMTAISAMNDLLNNYIVEAEVLLTLLKHASQLPPPAPLKSAEIVFRSAVVLRESKNPATGVTSITRVPIPDFEVYPGITVVCGRKGTGKTSAFEALSGAHRYEGSITVGGLEVSQNDIRAALFNGQQTFGSLSWPAAVLFSDADHNREAVRQALEWIGYPKAVDKLDRNLTDFSGGECASLQRAAVIYAALRDEADTDKPRILLFDEPTNHLDPESIELMKRGFVQLLRHFPNWVVVVISHDPSMKEIPGCTVIDLARQ